ncbi:Phosphate regulon sensor protein PhoR (SphS) [Minicystis rosea]|nr:Phosphate regulon sensor protein PhoR (SphS) [Minicystis rosea]
MLSERGGLRDWGLFGAAALVPAVAVGVLGLRALANEEAGARREAALGLAAAANQVAGEIERGVARAEEALGKVTVESDPVKAAATLRRALPAFAEPVVMAANRALVVPAAPRAASTGMAPPSCRRIAETIAAPPPRDEAAIAAAKREAIERCADGRTASGRFLWPVLALDPAAGVGPEVIADWIEAHAALLGDAEREATRIEVERAIGGTARERARAALSVSWSRRDAIAAELGRADVVSALRAGQAARGVVGFRAGAARGSLRQLDDGRLSGFVVDRGSLEGAIAAHAMGLPEGMHAQVIAGPHAEPMGASEERLSASVLVAPELSLRVVPVDPGAVARRASRSRGVLAGIGVAATACAFGLAALLFARMRAARRSSALRTDFVAAVSHELRTPIASMRMLAELLEERRVEPEEQGEVFEALAREARRLGETVDRLLGFSRMAAGRYVIERVPAKVDEVVGASIDTFVDRHPEVQVERAIEDGIVAEIDAGQVRLAVDNLLANAKKYAPEGGPYRVGVARADGGVAITVADRGPGIAVRDQRRIFEPFERADDRLSRATEGSGIGLSLVRHVAAAHGGRAFVESDLGRGAVFTIWIPSARRAS